MTPMVALVGCRHHHGPEKSGNRLEKTSANPPPYPPLPVRQHKLVTGINYMLNSCNERESKNPAASERATKQDDIVNSGGGLGKPNANQELHLIWGGSWW